ncbi:serine/threonine-protein kinase [Sphaerisporangium sp. TRM90804]|uniref:serine/threonine-protein kinase n=1 Tax=Sphaerisporangium sp. TRM90804 TaxID=3031113 RepID=UPI002446E79F|nr:serine/threonine-protein kinase [Sphaerisporangium sp. TRM90804]MDH2428832.1 protein kinase [Sphaerisporangium sp. TRM90804]
MPEQQTRLLADRYELIAPLGRGTMGTVWRAHDRLLGRDVAVKEIRQDSGLNKEQRDELRERMIREGRLAAKIAHPSVATVHDAIVVDGSPWIIMELVEARSLEQVIDEEGPLPPRLVAEIGLDLLSALAAAHEQDILHRDVKPANVLLTETGRVVLTDFGIAKASGDSNITKTGMVIGSPGYTAPERARGDHTGPESDLWSLGATLYFAVEGRPAYERATVSETLAALMTEQAEPPTQAGPLRPVLAALLEKDHTKRLSHAKTVAMLSAIARTSSRPPSSPSGSASGGASGPAGTDAAPKPTPGPEPARVPSPAAGQAPPATPGAPAKPGAPAGAPASGATPARPGIPAKPGAPAKPAVAGATAAGAAAAAGALSGAPKAAGSTNVETGASEAAGTAEAETGSPQAARTAKAGTGAPGAAAGMPSGAAAGPGETAGADTGDEEGFDPNQTMTVIRPKGGLRIPGAPRTASPSGLNEDEDDQATMVGLPPVTSAPQQPAVSLLDTPPVRPPAPAPARPPGGGDRPDDRTEVIPAPATPHKPSPAAAPLAVAAAPATGRAPRPASPPQAPGKPSQGADAPGVDAARATGRAPRPASPSYAPGKPSQAADAPAVDAAPATGRVPRPASPPYAPGKLSAQGSARPAAVPGTTGSGSPSGSGRAPAPDQGAGPRAASGSVPAQGTAPEAGAASHSEAGPEETVHRTGLGTDLFALQGSGAPPRSGTSMGMIALVVVALLGLAAIIMLAAAALSSDDPADSRAGSSAGARQDATPGGSSDASSRVTAEATSRVTSASAPAAGSAAPDASAAPAEGLRRHSDKTGFVIDVPEELSDVAKGRTVTFGGEGDVRAVRVSQSPGGSTNVLRTVRAAETKAIAAGTYPGYRMVRMAVARPAPYSGTDVVDWEFTHIGATGRVHVLSRWVAVPGGPLYAIYWSTPEVNWPEHRPQLAAVLSSFQPAPADAPGGS